MSETVPGLSGTASAVELDGRCSFYSGGLQDTGTIVCVRVFENYKVVAVVCFVLSSCVMPNVVESLPNVVE